MNDLFDIISESYTRSVRDFDVVCKKIGDIHDAEPGLNVFGKRLRRQIGLAIRDFIYHAEEFDITHPVLYSNDRAIEHLIEEHRCYARRHDAYPLELDMFDIVLEYAVNALFDLRSRAFREWVRFTRLDDQVCIFVQGVLQDTLESVELHEKRLRDSRR